MVNWKSKYLEMKLKYINAKNNLKGGMNSTEEPVVRNRFSYYLDLNRDMRENIQKRAHEEIKKKLTRTDDDIRQAVNAWCENPIDAEKKYGHISNWNTSNVTNMNYLFSNASDFNQDISNWDVSNVRTIISMFKDASSFNQDLNMWNPSNLDSVFTGNLNWTFRNTNPSLEIPQWYKNATAY